MARTLQAVLWDMDGTLIDTEPYWVEAEFALVAEYGGQWSMEHAHNLVGNQLLTSAQYIREHGGVDLPDLDIVHRLQSHVVRRVGEDPAWRPGARELLSELNDAGIPTALVTMSWRDLAGAVVAALPTGRFDFVITGDQVTHGKPHPEPYATAAAALRVAPEHCIALEDSVTGVTSAEAAGVLTIGIQHLVPIPATPTRRVVTSLEGITIDELERLLAAHRQ